MRRTRGNLRKEMWDIILVAQLLSCLGFFFLLVLCETASISINFTKSETRLTHCLERTNMMF